MSQAEEMKALLKRAKKGRRIQRGAEEGRALALELDLEGAAGEEKHQGEKRREEKRRLKTHSLLQQA